MYMLCLWNPLVLSKGHHHNSFNLAVNKAFHPHPTSCLEQCFCRCALPGLSRFICSPLRKLEDRIEPCLFTFTQIRLHDGSGRPPSVAGSLMLSGRLIPFSVRFCRFMLISILCKVWPPPGPSLLESFLTRDLSDRYLVRPLFVCQVLQA